MAREKGMGNLQREKSGRWTMRVCVDGKRYSRSTRTKDRDLAERVLQRFLSPLGLGERRLPLAEVWWEYVKSPNRNELAKATLDGKRQVWMQFAKWMEHFYPPVKDLGGVTSDMIAEYLACLRADVCATTYNARVCVLREIFHVLAKKAGIEEDPWEGVRLRPDDSHSRRELTMEELKRLLATAESLAGRSAYNGGNLAGRSAYNAGETWERRREGTTDNFGEWKTLFLIGIYTGLRLGDCCTLDWSQIDIARGVIQLVPKKTRRHHQRIVTIPIHPALGQALLANAGYEMGDTTDSSTGLGGESRSARGSDPTGCVGVASRTTHEALSTKHQAPLTGPVLPTIAEMYRTRRTKVSERLTEIFKGAQNHVNSHRLHSGLNVVYKYDILFAVFREDAP